MYIDYLSNSRTNGMNTGREYLTMEELAAIIKREFDSSRLEKVRDLYLFACYTGLVYQDIKNLQPYNIITAKDGTRWLSIRRQMHSSSWQIPLLENACQIIDKYKDNGTENLLPVPSIQKVNAYLKEIASQCGLDRNLSFQSARSTFADWHSQQSLPRDHFQTVRLPGLHHPFLPCLRQANQQRNA